MPQTPADRISGITTLPGVKAPCRVATTAAITLSGLQSIDGLSISAGDRVLVKDQADATQNGIYVAATGAWSRAADFDGVHDALSGTIVWVDRGVMGSCLFWQLTTADPVIFGSSSIAFAKAGVPGTTNFNGSTLLGSLRYTSGVSAAITVAGDVGAGGNQDSSTTSSATQITAAVSVASVGGIILISGGMTGALSVGGSILRR